MLTQEQAERIEQAVQTAEATTSSEIAVCVQRTSGDDRGLAAIIGAVLFVAIYTIGTAIWWNFDPLVWAGVALVGGILVFWLCDRFDLGLRCLPARLLVKDARRAARATFLDNDLDNTPERNAVLLFVSRAEHYVEILPDRAAAAAITPAQWEGIVEAFRRQMHQTDLGEAVANAVAAIGKLCAVHFPAAGANADRVSNRPIQS
ncbi:TPM domain-containing protein [Dongia deserti]|uniref:TPM domain-containing protein n=1 Tax=Dongia deserti TaxID=2268030 RepID=UPI0013C4DFCB|nr:TPM domain-containing protein [Dongia deserti]